MAVFPYYSNYPLRVKWKTKVGDKVIFTASKLCSRKCFSVLGLVTQTLVNIIKLTKNSPRSAKIQDAETLDKVAPFHMKLLHYQRADFAHDFFSLSKSFNQSICSNDRQKGVCEFLYPQDLLYNDVFNVIVDKHHMIYFPYCISSLMAYLSGAYYSNHVSLDYCILSWLQSTLSLVSSVDMYDTF